MRARGLCIIDNELKRPLVGPLVPFRVPVGKTERAGLIVIRGQWIIECPGIRVSDTVGTAIKRQVPSAFILSIAAAVVLLLDEHEVLPRTGNLTELLIYLIGMCDVLIAEGIGNRIAAKTVAWRRLPSPAFVAWAVIDFQGFRVRPHRSLPDSAVAIFVRDGRRRRIVCQVGSCCVLGPIDPRSRLLRTVVTRQGTDQSAIVVICVQKPPGDETSLVAQADGPRSQFFGDAQPGDQDGKQDRDDRDDNKQFDESESPAGTIWPVHGFFLIYKFNAFSR